jgi:hypothetical protein
MVFPILSILQENIILTIPPFGKIIDEINIHGTACDNEGKGEENKYQKRSLSIHSQSRFYIHKVR